MHRRRFAACASGLALAYGLMRPADTTFATKTDAEVWLTRKEAKIFNGDWINPDAGKVQLADYARRGSRNGPTSGRRRYGSTATCSAITYSRTSDRCRPGFS